MALYLVVKEGPLKGKRFLVKKGLIVSREQGDICLEDPKVSRRHAEVALDSKGQLYLKDLGSRNGLKVRGKKQTRIPLVPGVRFVVGKSELEVTETNPIAASADKTPSPVSEPIEEAPPEEWHESLSQLCKEAEKSTKNKGGKLLPFSPPISLYFNRGLQAETQWTLGYGPRIAGQKSSDLPIHDDRAPDACFELRPTAKGPEFLTQHPQEVLLNDQPIKSDVLRDGDTITINNVLITVSLDNE